MCGSNEWVVSVEKNAYGINPMNPIRGHCKRLYLYVYLVCRRCSTNPCCIIVWFQNQKRGLYKVVKAFSVKSWEQVISI